MKIISEIKEANEMSNRRIGKGKYIPLLIIAVLLLSGMIAIAGCGGSSALEGKWAFLNEDMSPSDKYYIEFFSDGTAKMFIFQLIYYNWKVEKGQLILTEYNGGTRITLEYKISGSTLTIPDLLKENVNPQLKKIKNTVDSEISALAGKWEYLNEDMSPSGKYIELFLNGIMKDDKITIAHYYWKAEKGQFTITNSVVSYMTYTYDYKISGSTLTIMEYDSRDEKDVQLIRVKK